MAVPPRTKTMLTWLAVCAISHSIPIKPFAVPGASAGQSLPEPDHIAVLLMLTCLGIGGEPSGKGEQTREALQPQPMHATTGDSLPTSKASLLGRGAKLPFSSSSTSQRRPLTLATSMEVWACSSDDKCAWPAACAAILIESLPLAAILRELQALAWHSHCSDAHLSTQCSWVSEKYASQLSLKCCLTCASVPASVISVLLCMQEVPLPCPVVLLLLPRRDGGVRNRPLTPLLQWSVLPLLAHVSCE